MQLALQFNLHQDGVLGIKLSLALRMQVEMKQKKLPLQTSMDK
jgi:hypothetical protein